MRINWWKVAGFIYGIEGAFGVLGVLFLPYTTAYTGINLELLITFIIPMLKLIIGVGIWKKSNLALMGGVVFLVWIISTLIMEPELANIKLAGIIENIILTVSIAILVIQTLGERKLILKSKK